MAEVALIIGNGLDLDLGLPSRYSDFIRSKEWEDVVKRNELFLADNSYRNHSLIAQLQKASENSQWFDIEEQIHEFIKDHPNLTEQDIREVEGEFNGIKKALCKYLRRSVEKFDFKPENRRLSSELLYFLFDNPCNVTEFNFNYTNVHELLGDSYRVFPTFIHGSLEEDDIVLGCDIQENEEVNRDLSFMYKYNMLKNANHIVANMLAAKEVIIFGHSINEMDFCYFREYLRVASSSSQHSRCLTIITLDERSEINIKDNIRNQGISVSDLYNNLNEITFVHTKNYYKGEEIECKKIQDLVFRLNHK